MSGGSSWRIPVPPKTNELLSSWLIRAARRYACTPSDFTHYVWGSNPSWTRDLDRWASISAIATLNHRLRGDVREATSTSLRSFCERLGSPPPGPGITPGILAVGVYHRLRNRYGLQYCPQCLFEDQEPYFRRDWRLAHVWICTRHGCVLRDCCPSCESPIAPHRATFLQVEKCWECDSSLLVTSPAASDQEVSAHAHIQLFWQTNSIGAGKAIASFPDWLAATRRLYATLASTNPGQLMLKNALTAISHPRSSTEPSHPLFELGRVEDRGRLLTAIVSMTHDWPSTFLRLAKGVGLRRNQLITFSHSSITSCLMSVAKMLPLESRKPRRKQKKAPAYLRMSTADARQRIDLSAAIARRIASLPSAPSKHRSEEV